MNDVKVIKKPFREAFKVLGVTAEDVLVCAYYEKLTWRDAPMSAIYVFTTNNAESEGLPIC